MTNFQKFFDKHAQHGLTGSYHGDMAATLDLMRQDPEFRHYPDAQADMTRAVMAHLATERGPYYKGRKWFCERFGSQHERSVIALNRP